MDWQLLSVTMCLAAAVGYLGRRAWRTWTARRSCGNNCCGAGGANTRTSALISAEELVTRQRTK